jgi:hypothetical protein
MEAPSREFRKIPPGLGPPSLHVNSTGEVSEEFVGANFEVRFEARPLKKSARSHRRRKDVSVNRHRATHNPT